jgi:GNAT superfamily N-acetyltransferase
VAPEHDRTVGDMLIALYRLPAYCADNFSGAEIRKPLAPEYDLVVRWVEQQFSPGWASEARSAVANRPVSLFIAVREDNLLGFCSYDATARGFVGPIGVQATARGQDVGAALLRACLADMRAAGYGYAIAGAVGAPEFFRRVAGATPIPDSSPGLYKGMLRDPPL